MRWQRVRGGQGALEQRGCADAVDAGAKDRQQISTELVDRWSPGGRLRGSLRVSLGGRLWGCQCVCLGSDQAERPVTTSNFLRRELTT